MSRPIDEKLVVMKLDNSDFKQKAVETTSLFGKLKDSLNKIPGVNLGKTTQDLGNIQKAASATNLDALNNSLNVVTSRFSNLGVVATTALVNISNRAVNAGLSLANSLSLEQVTSGFKEYETKIGAIGTVLSNTEWAGTTLTDVKVALEELNDYADDTKYNFGQMTENIGRFTAAGVTLGDSTTAIKGLSNLAASSGSTSEQLNTAMYQMSQALAAGKLTLMDWNSLVNAGMAGKKTQDALVETAKAMGKNVDLSDGFRNSIEQGWLTSEVFLETLKKFGKDKSMTEMARSVRTLTTFMDSLKESIGSGWATTWELIFGDFEQATKFWTSLSDSVGGFFEKSTKARNYFIKGVADRGGISNVFDGIVNAAKPVTQIFGALSEAFERIFPPMTITRAVQLTKAFKEFTSGMKLSNETVSKLTRIFMGVFSIFSTVWEITKRLGKAFVRLIPEGTGSSALDLMENIANLAIEFNRSIKEGNGVTAVIEGLGNVLGAVGEAIGIVIGTTSDFSKSIRDNIGGAIDWLKEKLAPVGKFLKDTFGDFGGEDILGAGALAGIFFVVKKVTDLLDGFGDITGMVDGISDVLDGVGDAVQNFANGIKYTNLILIATALGILAVALKTMSDIDAEDLAKGITSLATSLGVMLGGMILIDKFKITGGLRASATLIGLAIAVSIMASALKKISDLKPSELIKGIGGLVGVVGALSIAIIAISKFGGKMKVGSLQLIALSTAVYILADAIKKMSEIDSGDLFRSVGAMALIFAQLAIFLKVVDRTKLGVGSAIGLLAVAGAVQIMVSAIEKISEINVKQLIKGLGTIAILLAQIVIFSKLVSGGKLLLAGAGLLVLSIALNALVRPIREFGKMSLVELAKGLGAMAAALVIIAGAAMLLQGSIVGAAGLTVMAIALNLLVRPIKEFADMTWGELVKGFVGLAGGLAVLAGVSLLLSPAVLPMLAFSVALLAMGAAVALVGAGIALFGTGLVTLSTLTATSVAAIISALGLLIKGLGTLIVDIVKFVVDLGVALIEGIGRLVPPLIETIANLIITLLQTISDKLPEFLKLGVDIVIKLIDGIAEYVPQLVQSGVDAMINLINGLADAIEQNGPEFISAWMRLMGEVILLMVESGVQTVNALFGWIPGVKEATAEIGATAEQYIRDNFGAAEAGTDKGKDFSNSLSGTSGDAKSAGKAIANAGKDGAGSVSMTSTGSNFGLGFASGINSKSVLAKVATSALSLAMKAKNTVTGWLEIFSPSRALRRDGGHFGEGFALGISDKVKRVGDSAKSLAVTAKDKVNEFLDGFDPQPKDNEIKYKVVIDDDDFNPDDYAPKPVLFRPDTRYTQSLVTSSDYRSRQNGNTTPIKESIHSSKDVDNTKQPAVIQVVTPEKREVARWLVDDITDFQDFKIDQLKQF